MKKIILSSIVAIIAICGVCYSLKHQTKITSALVLENIEALSSYEFPEVSISCSSGSSGQCFQEVFDRWVMSGEKMFHPCRYTGNQSDYCS